MHKLSSMSLIALILILTEVSLAICKIPDDLEKPINPTQRMECLKNSYFLQPEQSNVDLGLAVRGPELKGELTFDYQEQVYCRYFYRYQNGSSNKFRCYRTNEKNQLMNDKGEVVSQAVSVGTFNSDQEDVLFDAQGKAILTTKGKQMKADVLKVRFQDGSKRHRENYSSTVASRIAWIMGFPTENYYSVKNVYCFGCEKNPWNNGLKPQLIYNPQVANNFLYASIERKHEAKRVIKAYVPQNKKFETAPWKWEEYMQYWAQLTYEQKIGIQVLGIFANFLQTVENRGSQHVLLCEKEYYNKESNTCVKTLAGTHDIGSAFGNRDIKWLDQQTKNHPRADFDSYNDVKIFKPGTCDLVSVPGGPKGRLTTISEEARIEFVRRSNVLNYSMIKEILRSAYFQYADLIKREQIRQKEKIIDEQSLNERMLDLWTTAIQAKLDVIRNARCSQ